MLASSVVNRHVMVPPAALRCSCQAATSAWQAARSGMRRARHGRLRTLSSIAAVCGRVVDLEFVGEAFGLLGGEGVVQGRG